MKPDDHVNEDRDGALSVVAIEAALSRLAVTVPHDLEAKLLAAIPQPLVETEKKLKRKSHLPWIAVGAAASVLGVALLWGRNEPTRDGGPEVVSAQPDPTTIAFTMVKSKETDPCNILPPLADWR